MENNNIEESQNNNINDAQIEKVNIKSINQARDQELVDKVMQVILKIK